MLYEMAQYKDTLIDLTTNGFSILNNFYTKLVCHLAPRHSN